MMQPYGIAHRRSDRVTPCTAERHPDPRLRRLRGRRRARHRRLSGGDARGWRPGAAHRGRGDLRIAPGDRPMKRSTLALLICAALGGCATLPAPHALPKMKPARAYSADQSFAAPAASWPADEWWRAYKDPQ